MSRNSLFDYSGLGLNFTAKTVRLSRALIPAVPPCQPYSTAQIVMPFMRSFAQRPDLSRYNTTYPAGAAVNRFQGAKAASCSNTFFKL